MLFHFMVRQHFLFPKQVIVTSAAIFVTLHIYYFSLLNKKLIKEVKQAKYKVYSLDSNQWTSIL